MLKGHIVNPLHELAALLEKDTRIPQQGTKNDYLQLLHSYSYPRDSLRHLHNLWIDFLEQIKKGDELMSAELSKLWARGSAQEQQAIATATRIEEVAQDVESIAGQVAEVKTSIEALSQSVERRLEHVYGELADIKANTVEIRDLLASLIARLEKSSS